MTTHPNDKLAALDWAVSKAREESRADDMVRLMHLPALQELRDQALREVRGG